MNGVTKRAQPMIKWIDVVLPEEITLNSLGEYNLSSVYPTGMKNFLFATPVGWSRLNGYAVMIMSNGLYVGGTPGQVIKGLRVRYYYTD